MGHEVEVDADDGYLTRLLSAVWDRVASGDGHWNPEKSCHALADEYGRSGLTTSECVMNFIHWQTAKTGMAGFVSGVPGLAFGAITIPMELLGTAYIHLRMVATIALMHGWNIRSDQVKTIALAAVLGDGAAQAVAVPIGRQVANKVGGNTLAKVPGRLLIRLNKAVGFRLVTKAGTKGVVNLTKLVPVLGGLVSGGINVVATRQIGLAANAFFEGGPGVFGGPSQGPVVA